MTTARVVGGDLYDYRILDNGSVFVAIGDVSGKGITAALFMARAITLLNQYAKLGYSPAKILFEFNNDLAAHNPNMMFITAFVAVYDPKTGELTYSNAGHNYPYILSGKLTALNTDNGIMAGSFEDVVFPEYAVKMKPGDCLFMYTDGVTEAENKKVDCSTVFNGIITDYTTLLTEVIEIKKIADEKSEYKTSALMDGMIESYTKKLWMLKQSME